MRAALALSRRLPAVVLAALGRPLAEPQVVLLFLLVNLAAALVLAAPMAGLLSAELDRNLYGEEMATGASWRWFDTVDREHPHAFGDLGAWTALLSEDGVRPRDVARLSGPAAGVALAGLLLYLVHAVLHTGWLAAGRWRSSEGSAAGLLHRAGLFALPALGLAAFAAVGYVAVYGAAYVATGPPLARLARAAQSESLHMLFLWLRLGATALLLLAVKLWFDLAKAALVESGNWRLGAAAARAARELARRGWAYAAAWLALAAGTLAVSLLWLLVADPLVPRTWIGLAVVFVLHQMFLAIRVWLRLAQLGATQRLLLLATELRSPATARPRPAPPA
ncbi:MAG TPA: hypothetical protein VHM02_07320 [Thermoanaerobaculia bacterium]|nr:hypothetical protein [Thermoanaerobaculia bacterium]